MIDNEISHLHPKMRVQASLLQARLMQTPLRVFETYRSPERQRQVLADGHSKAPEFESAHQYGLALDFAVQIDGIWHWPPATADIWHDLHTAATRLGLSVPLKWDPGHVQWPDWRK